MATTPSSISSNSTPLWTDTSPDLTPFTPQAPVTALRKRRPPRIYRPAKNSLYDIFQQHAGTSLFVRPIYWIDLHAQLLGVRWEVLPLCDTPQPVVSPGTLPSRGHLAPSDTITTLSNALTQILLPDPPNPAVLSKAVRTVLETCWPEAFSRPHCLPRFHLCFGGRVYRNAVRAHIMWNFPSDATKSSYSSFKSISARPVGSFNISTQSSPAPGLANLPMICYVGKSQLATIRNNVFRVAPGPGGSFNEPVLRAQQLRARLLVPSNSDHDAYFVSIFLGMAQTHFYSSLHVTSRETQMSSEKGIPPSPGFQDLKLRILTHDTNTSEFIVYTGYVTKEFLEKFHDPFKSPTGDGDGAISGLEIKYTRVPIWPILGLRERLGKAFGQDIVGPFNPDKMETWEVDPEKPDGGKSKLETLSKIIKKSFEECSDDESPRAEKKRCLSRRTPAGVTR